MGAGLRTLGGSVPVGVGDQAAFAVQQANARAGVPGSASQDLELLLTTE